MHITISARAVIKTLSVIIGVLITAHSVQIILEYFRVSEYVPYLDVDTEGNLPSFYSALAIECCAFLLLLIYVYERKTVGRFRWAWLGLTIIFAFLGLDEATRIHEDSGDFVEGIIDPSGELNVAWLYPYVTMVVILGILYFRWLLDLPAGTRTRFVVSAIVFLSGAVGMEILGGEFPPVDGDYYTFPYIITYTLEEGLEMLGIALFARALVMHISAFNNPLIVRFSN